MCRGYNRLARLRHQARVRATRRRRRTIARADQHDETHGNGHSDEKSVFAASIDSSLLDAMSYGIFHLPPPCSRPSVETRSAFRGTHGLLFLYVGVILRPTPNHVKKIRSQKGGPLIGLCHLKLMGMITCYLRYFIAPGKLKEF